MIDCAAFIGSYPFRQVPHPDPDILVGVLAREGLDGAWVGYLPSAWHRDPTPGNAALFAALAPHPWRPHPATPGAPDVLPARFEALRQRHPLDVAGDLTAAHVRAVARAGEVRLVVTGAGRELLEEVHWGLTPDEQRRVHWDFAWIWGPPEDQLAHLFRTVGAGRVLHGHASPPRLT